MLRKKEYIKGFTLIEVMIVVVILGIIVAIAIPNFLAAQERAKVANVKVNMKTMQLMVETYSTDNRGSYAVNITDLRSEAIAKNYWKELKNPLTSQMGLGNAYADQTTGINATTGVGTIGIGVLGYNPVLPNPTKYYIYGGSQVINKALLEKNITFYLSNG